MTQKKNPNDLQDLGRPTVYRPEYAEQSFKYCLLGATDAQLADFFEVCEKTINTWKHKHPDFLQSTKRGKVLADANVAESLCRRAMGYEHPENKIFHYQGKPVVVPTIKHYPPDTQAASLWLRNRQPELWRDKQDIELKQDPEEKRTTAELLASIKATKKEIERLKAQL